MFTLHSSFFPWLYSQTLLILPAKNSLALSGLPVPKQNNVFCILRADVDSTSAQQGGTEITTAQHLNPGTGQIRKFSLLHFLFYLFSLVFQHLPGSLYLSASLGGSDIVSVKLKAG